MPRKTFRTLIKEHDPKDPLAHAKLDALCIAEELGYGKQMPDYVFRIINATKESQITLTLKTARERWCET